MMVEWIMSLHNMAFESGGVPEDWRSPIIIPLYKGKREKTEYNFIHAVRKIYAEILVDKEFEQ